MQDFNTQYKDLSEEKIFIIKTENGYVVKYLRDIYAERKNVKMWGAQCFKDEEVEKLFLFLCDYFDIKNLVIKPSKAK